jgi:RND family efflux transporter MFP subunit
VTAQNALQAAQAALPDTAQKDAATVAQSQGVVQAAVAQVAAAQAGYDNTVAPPTAADIKAGQAQVQQAQAAVTVAQTAVAQMKITAPFAGVLGSQLLQVGALASPTTPVATLVSNQVQVQVNVEQANASKVSVGQPVAITVTAYPGVTFPAKITLVAPVADPTSHAFQTTVTPDPADARLKAGMFANVVITTQDVPNAVVVPSAAVLQQGSQNVIYIVKNNQAQMVPIKTGITTDSVTQILGGITPGEPVVTTGQDTLRAGEAVHVLTTGGAAGAPGAGRAGTPAAGGTPRRRTSGSATSTGGRATPTP